MLDTYLHNVYNPQGYLRSQSLIDLQFGNIKRGICTLLFTRQSDKQVIYTPINIIDNIYASNGMSAGNTRNEALVQDI